MSIEVTRVRHAWPEQAGFTISRPKGIDSYTFIYFHNSVKLTVRGSTVTTTPGSCIIYRPNSPQWFQSNEPLRHDWIHLTGDVEAALAEAGLEADRVYVPENGRFITELTRHIESEHFSKPTGHRLMNELKFRELLLRLARSCSRISAHKRLKPAMEKQLLVVRDTVFSQLSNDWTVEKMAKLCYLSPSRFHTVYKILFGISPTDDLIHARIENAKNRLSNDRESVKSISDALGYKNTTHFCRQFKKLTGLTPMEYRQEIMQ